MRFADKITIVTGAGSGIGQATARKFAAEGAAVTCADIKGDTAQATAAEIEENGGRALAITANIGKREDCQRLVQETIDHFGRVDILVNNAGIGSIHTFLETTPEDWERVMAVNVSGAFYCGQAAARDMAKRGWGRIVSVASISGQRAGWARVAYGTSKAAVIHLTRQMAMELGPLGITANAIGPGPTETPIIKDHHTPGTIESYLQMIPSGRYGTPKDQADAILFLASDEAEYINGHTLNVDGGYTISGVKFDDL